MWPKAGLCSCCSLPVRSEQGTGQGDTGGCHVSSQHVPACGCQQRWPLRACPQRLCCGSGAETTGAVLCRQLMSHASVLSSSSSSSSPAQGLQGVWVGGRVVARELGGNGLPQVNEQHPPKHPQSRQCAFPQPIDWFCQLRMQQQNKGKRSFFSLCLLIPAYVRLQQE